MAKTLDDLTWLACTGDAIATVGVSAALTEVVGYRQKGVLSRVNPETEVVVLMGDLFYTFPSAVAAAMFDPSP